MIWRKDDDLQVGFILWKGMAKTGRFQEASPIENDPAIRSKVITCLLK